MAPDTFKLSGDEKLTTNFALDRALGTESRMFLSATACYYIANEGLSVLENAQALGIPIPEALRGALENVRRKGEK